MAHALTVDKTVVVSFKDRETNEYKATTLEFIEHESFVKARE